MSQSGTILASGSRDESTILWRIDSYEQLFVFQGERYVNALDFSADDQRVFIGTGDGKHLEHKSNKEIKMLFRIGNRKSE